MQQFVVFESHGEQSRLNYAFQLKLIWERFTASASSSNPQSLQHFWQTNALVIYEALQECVEIQAKCFNILSSGTRKPDVCVIRCERFKPLSKMSFDCATFGTRFNIPVLARLVVKIFSSFSAKLCFLPSLSSSSSRLPLATTKERQLLPEQQQEQHRFFFLRCCCCCCWKTRATEERAPTKEEDEEEREDATTRPNRRGGEMGFRLVVAAALENDNIAQQQPAAHKKVSLQKKVEEGKSRRFAQGLGFVKKTLNKKSIERKFF